MLAVLFVPDCGVGLDLWLTGKDYCFLDSTSRQLSTMACLLECIWNSGFFLVCGSVCFLRLW